MNRTVVLIVNNPTVAVEEMMRGLQMEAADTGSPASLHSATPLDL